MGKAKFWPSGAPKHLNGFRWNLEYITGPRVWPHMQIHVALRQRGGPICVIIPKFAKIGRSGPILTFYTSYDVFSPKDVPFGVSFILLPYLGVKSPPKKTILRAWIGIFKLKVQNIKICILSKLLHRLQPNFAQSRRPPSTLRGWPQHA